MADAGSRGRAAHTLGSSGAGDGGQGRQLPPRAPARADSPLAVSLFTSHPLMMERMRLQLSRPPFEVHAYLLSTAWREIAPASDGVWVIDGHDPELVRQVLARLPGPRPPVVVAADAMDDTRAFGLLFLGVRGLVDYTRLAHDLARAIEAVHSGAYWVSRIQMARFVDHLLTRFPHPEKLAPMVRISARERQVLDAILDRLGNKEIAARLGLSERTVKFHVSNLLRRFGVARRHDLALQFLRSRDDRG